MEISPAPDHRPNGYPVNGRKRGRSPSILSDHGIVRRRLDTSSSQSSQAINTEIAPSILVKKESVSEMDVLNFLNAIPLKEQNTNASVGMVLAQESRRIQFGPEMFVIAAQRGSPSNASMTIEFDIDDNQMFLISLWKRRNKTQKYFFFIIENPSTEPIHCFSDVSRSLCLTLACYRCADLPQKTQGAGGTPSYKELLSGVNCSWPITGGLSMIVRHNEDEWQLPLSPPLCVGPHASTFVRDAHN